MTKETDLSRFSRNPNLLKDIEVFFVVKSQDQLERRKRLIESLEAKGEKFGRLKDREISEGLLVRTTLGSETDVVTSKTASLVKQFREPRGFFQASPDRFFITDVNSILLLDEKGSILSRFQHPYFSYMHSLDFNRERNALVTVSSGYDAVFEFNINSGKLSWEWFGWEHGFNPRKDGVYLTRDLAQQKEYESKGLKAEYVDAGALGEKGLFTGTRIMHPNSAAYVNSRKILVTYGFQGILAEIDLQTGKCEKKLEVGKPMPHGIFKRKNGWGLTNTLRGEFWCLNAEFQITEKIVFRNLPEKVAGLGENEWLQTTVELRDGLLLGLDANRGLIGVDLETREYCVIKTDENWCLQEAALSREELQ